MIRRPGEIAVPGERLRLLPLRVATPEGQLPDASRHGALGRAVECVERPVEIAAALVPPGELHPFLVEPEVPREAELVETVMRGLAVGVIHEDRRGEQRTPEHGDVIPAPDLDGA